MNNKNYKSIELNPKLNRLIEIILEHKKINEEIIMKNLGGTNKEATNLINHLIDLGIVYSTLEGYRILTLESKLLNQFISNLNELKKINTQEIEQIWIDTKFSIAIDRVIDGKEMFKGEIFAHKGFIAQNSLLHKISTVVLTVLIYFGTINIVSLITNQDLSINHLLSSSKIEKIPIAFVLLFYLICALLITRSVQDNLLLKKVIVYWRDWGENKTYFYETFSNKKDIYYRDISDQNFFIIEEDIDFLKTKLKRNWNVIN